MGEGGQEPAGTRVEGEKEPCVAIAALGFPIVFLTLLAHGFGIFVVRQGYWSPSPALDLAWTALLVVGVGAGLGLSAWRGAGLRRN